MPTPAEDLYQQFVDGKQARVEECLGEVNDEWLYLDYKENTDDSGAPTSKLNRKVYSNAASSLASTEGGVIVWGVEAKDNKPCVSKPIPEIAKFVASLNEFALQILDPPLPGIANHAVPIKGGGGIGYAVSYIPKSSTAPHRALLGSKAYMMRSGAGATDMPDRLVRALIMARARPELELIWSEPRVKHSGKGKIVKKYQAGMEHIFDAERFETTIRIWIKNTGSVMAEEIAFALSLPAGIEFKPGRCLRDTVGQKVNTGLPGQAELHRLPASTPIYPGMTIEVGEISQDFVFEPEKQWGIAMPVSLYARDYSATTTVVAESHDVQVLIDKEILARGLYRL